MTFKDVTYLTDILTDNRVGIHAVVDGVSMSIPLDPDNSRYAEIVRQVREEGLVISEPVPTVTARRTGTPREFLYLFTSEETVRFFTAKASNVQLEVWWAQASTGDFSLDHPAVAPGLQALVALEVITEARAEIILATDFDKV